MTTRYEQAAAALEQAAIEADYDEALRLEHMAEDMRFMAQDAAAEAMQRVLLEEAYALQEYYGTAPRKK